MESLPNDITTSAWEDRESIVCYKGKPIGGTISERDIRGIHTFISGRGIWKEICRIILDAAVESEGEDESKS